MPNIETVKIFKLSFCIMVNSRQKSRLFSIFKDGNIFP